jgi:hypothetical protein
MREMLYYNITRVYIWVWSRIGALAALIARALHRSHTLKGRAQAALKTEGAGKTGCALHPRSRVQKQRRKTHTSIQVQRKQSGLPCAMVYGLYRALPGETGLVCHRHPQEA